MNDEATQPPAQAESPSRPKLKPAESVEITAQNSPSGVYTGKRGFSGGDAVSELPAPTFTVLGVDVQKVATAPTLKFTLGVNESTGREVFTIALMVQIQIVPAQRKYDPETREKLFELFGEPSRWATTTRSFPWYSVSVLVPTFSGATTFELPIASNFDLELAATKYFYSLPDGEVPLSFHFSGSIYYKGEDGGIQVVQVPWSTSAQFRLPIDRWRAMVDFFYPNTAWITLKRQTLDQLLEYKIKEGLATFDACVTKLMGVEDFHQPNPFAFRKSQESQKSMGAPAAPPVDTGADAPAAAPPVDTGADAPAAAPPVDTGADAPAAAPPVDTGADAPAAAPPVDTGADAPADTGLGGPAQ